MASRAGALLIAIVVGVVAYAVVQVLPNPPAQLQEGGGAQTGQITGFVRDPSGATLSGAVVLAKSMKSGVVQRGTSDDTGRYLVNVEKSTAYITYNVTASHCGYWDSPVQQVRVSDSPVRLDIALAPNPNAPCTPPDRTGPGIFAGLLAGVITYLIVRRRGKGDA